MRPRQGTPSSSSSMMGNSRSPMICTRTLRPQSWPTRRKLSLLQLRIIIVCCFAIASLSNAHLIALFMMSVGDDGMADAWQSKKTISHTLLIQYTASNSKPFLNSKTQRRPCLPSLPWWKAKCPSHSSHFSRMSSRTRT